MTDKQRELTREFFAAMGITPENWRKAYRALGKKARGSH